ncbi:hypothetical protein [Sporosarcina sp. FA9]|uniref:hypothetical protein n=1 Tax=Sporosarcina sp. FA9 TaxID=3413030 RepID=UPI003F65E56C
MGLPATAFVTLPELVQPLLSNGLLMGILAALFMELLFTIGNRIRMKKALSNKFIKQ